MKCQEEGCNHKATVTFASEPMFALTHGFGREICQCCYVKNIEAELKNIKYNYIKQNEILISEGCE